MSDITDSHIREEQLFDSNGQDITDGQDAKGVCAKIVIASNRHMSKNRFFVKEYGGELFDPLISQTDYGYQRRRWRLRSISETGFNHYINFLQKRNGNALRRAERELRTNG